MFEKEPYYRSSESSVNDMSSGFLNIPGVVVTRFCLYTGQVLIHEVSSLVVQYVRYYRKRKKEYLVTEGDVKPTGSLRTR